MNQSQQGDRIVEYLRIKPINHGQIYTFQIAVPEHQKIAEIPAQRHEELRRSLVEQGTNLIPLVVRRTEAYSEEEEYEVVYGTDWCLVAKELDIEKLWVWVFDMTDEQAAATKAQMEQLTNLSDTAAVAITPFVSEKTESTSVPIQKLDKFFEQMQALSRKLEQSLISTKIVEKLDNQQGSIHQKIDNLTDKLEQISLTTTAALEQIFNQISQTKDSKSQNSTKQISYSRLKKDELKKLAEAQQISVTKQMTKADLIAALKKADTAKVN